MWRNPKYSGEDAGTAQAEAPRESGTRLATLPRRGPAGEAQELRVVLDAYNGHEYLSVRLWQGDRGSWWPVKGKGVSVRLSEAEPVAAALLGGLRRAGDVRSSGAARRWGTGPQSHRRLENLENPGIRPASRTGRGRPGGFPDIPDSPDDNSIDAPPWVPASEAEVPPPGDAGDFH